MWPVCERLAVEGDRAVGIDTEAQGLIDKEKTSESSERRV